MEERTSHHVKKTALLPTVCFVALGLITGLFVYDSIKGKGTTMTRGREAVAAGRMAVPPPIDVSKPQRIETATFALG